MMIIDAKLEGNEAFWQAYAKNLLKTIEDMVNGSDTSQAVVVGLVSRLMEVPIEQREIIGSLDAVLERQWPNSVERIHARATQIMAANMLATVMAERKVRSE